jgi:hypothetical protein
VSWRATALGNAVHCYRVLAMKARMARSTSSSLLRNKKCFAPGSSMTRAFRRKVVENMCSIAKARQQHRRVPCSAPIKYFQVHVRRNCDRQYAMWGRIEPLRFLSESNGQPAY